MDLTTQTPVEIDTAWEILDRAHLAASREVASAVQNLHYAANDQRDYRRGGYVWRMDATEALEAARKNAADEAAYAWDRKAAQTAIEKYDEAVAAQAEAKAAMAPYRAEWARRGGWSRAFIVPQGHVHSSMDCSTCNNGAEPTRFGWLPNLSGHDEAEIVDLAGDRACTVCFPSAPVETAGPSRLFHEDEVAAEAARKERAEAKAARDAKKIAKALTEDGSEFRVSYTEGGWVKSEDGTSQVWAEGVRTRSESFKTEQAAVQWMVQYVIWDGDHGNGGKADAFQAIKDAMAAKHNLSAEEVEAIVAKKVADKRKRDAR